LHLSLLIDRNYTALSIIPWKRAAKLLIGGKAEPIDGRVVKKVKTISGTYDIPSIVRLVVAIPWRVHRNKLKFSRKGVMIRDQFNCQYCCAKIKKGGTIDHVIPRSRGGKSNYNNCVACCSACNNKKADLTPERAGLKLIRKPKAPTFISLYQDKINTFCPEEWADYIIGL